MNESGKGLLALGREIVNKSRFSNAMGIPLVFVVIVFLGGLTGYIATQKDVFTWIMLLPVVFFICSFIYLMLFKPHLLRTEEHEERMLQLASGMGQKGELLEETNEADLEIVVPDQVPKPKQIEDRITR